MGLKLCQTRGSRKRGSVTVSLTCSSHGSLSMRVAVLRQLAREALEATGSPIGMADYQIAGVCLSRSALLLTRNRAHFERVSGLRLGGFELSDG